MKVVLICTILISTIVSLDALKCYKTFCNFSTNKPVDCEETIQECTTIDTSLIGDALKITSACNKIITIIGNSTTINKGCTVNVPSLKCVGVKDTVETCNCDTDLCNGSLKLSIQISFVLFITTILTYLLN